MFGVDEMLKPIEVIAIHDKKGHIKPYRFQMVEDGEMVTVQITGSMMYEHQHVARDNDLLRFKCKTTVHGYARECELMYHVQSMKWNLTAI